VKIIPKLNGKSELNNQTQFLDSSVAVIAQVFTFLVGNNNLFCVTTICYRLLQSGIIIGFTGVKYFGIVIEDSLVLELF
jgi:hypothetical protein